MRISDFDLYRDLLYEKSGLSLTPDKSYLLDSRLTPVARKWHYPSLESLTMALRGVPDPGLIKDVVEAMAAGDTSFFRDVATFTALRERVIPGLAKSRKSKKLRFWCAAVSTGQEAYSVAMALKEMGPLVSGMSADLVATDISTEAVESAKKGLYTQYEVQRGLPVRLLLKYFDQEGAFWVLKSDIRKMVQFRYFNLLDGMAPLGTFDVIFCRNVLTGFDADTRRTVSKNLAACLNPGGYLVLGAAETLPDGVDGLAADDGGKGLYQAR